MKSIGVNFGVAICGLVTSILVAIANVVIANMTGINVFTFNIWVLVPAGAALIGAAAASGYYFGSLYFHKKPTWALAVQMVVIAGFAQFLIYYLEYTTLVLDDGTKASDLVNFSTYLDVSLTKAHYRMGRGAHIDTGEVGSFGYTIAVVQFIGFLIGGVFVSFSLWAKDTCQKCEMYLRPLAKKKKTFSDGESCSEYYDNLFHHPVDTPEFASLIQMEAKAPTERGTISVDTTLLGCPSCKEQMIYEKVQVYNGRDWKDINDLERKVPIPEGIDLTPAFRG